MRILIFSSQQEADLIKGLLGGEIFNPNKTGAVDLIHYLNDNDHALAIIVGDVLTMGWCIYHPARVIFSQQYPKDERTRTQAKARVRTPTRI